MKRAARVLVVCAVVASGAQVAAADQSLHATGTVTTGFSDNILNVPESDEVNHQADAFAAIAPGMLFTFQSPRFRAQVRYTLSARLFFTNNSANSFSNFLNIRTETVLSPVSSVELTASGAAGRINAFETVPDQTMVDQLPQGDIAYARGIASQAYSRALNYDWAFRQNLNFGAFTPTDETTAVNTNYDLGGTLALERTWKHHQVTGSFVGKYVYNERVNEAGDPLDPDKQVHLGPQARWLWDISGSLSAAATVGLTRVFDPNDFETGLYQPQLSAQLSYLKARSVVTARYLHGVTTNSLVGQSSTVDRGELRGYYPLTELLEGAGVTGTIGLQHAQFIDVQAESLTAESNQFVTDVAGTYKQNDTISWALRYQFAKQSRVDPVLGAATDASRHQIQAVLTIQYPDRQAVELAERNDDRVDGASDEDMNEFRRNLQNR